MSREKKVIPHFFFSALFHQVHGAVTALIVTQCSSMLLMDVPFAPEMEAATATLTPHQGIT